MTIHAELPARAIAQGGKGTVVASARLVVPTRDTIVVHDTIATTRMVTHTVFAGSAQTSQPRATASPPSASVMSSALPPPFTRIAQFRDSTFAGIIAGVVTAPPDSAPLGITYHLTRPAFDPTITFMTTASHPLAVVSWQGERVTVDHVTLPSSQPRWFRAVDVNYSPTTKAVSVSGWLGVRVWSSIDLVATVVQPITTMKLPTPVITVRKQL